MHQEKHLGPAAAPPKQVHVRPKIEKKRTRTRLPRGVSCPNHGCVATSHASTSVAMAVVAAARCSTQPGWHANSTPYHGSAVAPMSTKMDA